MDGKYVVLTSKLDGSKLICDTPANAVKALDELGLCSNQAILTTFQGQGQRVPLLMYQGARFKAGSDCYVEIPFSEYEDSLGNNLQQLLWEIFKPFVFEAYYAKISSIAMNPDPGVDRCFQFHLCLMFKDESALAAIAAELSKVADEEEVVEAKYYTLD